MQRMHAQQTHLQERREALLAILGEHEDAALGTMQEDLETHLQQRVAMDTQLDAARAQAEQIENRLCEQEQRRLKMEQAVQEKRTELQRERLDAQENKVRCDTIREQLDETGFDGHALLEAMDDDDRIEDWEERVSKMAQTISRLGPINLAAIDEYNGTVERKEYLDTQHTDLTQALSTLENAIAKIDKETRSRFKETFDRVNMSISEIFPKLFGGGQAYLELTDNDLLETGVTIMAKPPGKRISNIHLLSGGEKALTAVAMVFAIFELNPAPFCMLDEVDAPLDEANIGSFAKIVKEMSARVQFIFITHNKATMELADQLIGVTMREPGVSRLVSVDIEEAVKMVDA